MTGAGQPTSSDGAIPRGAGLFDAIAAAYARARPPYPAALYAHLAQRGLIGPGRDVLEVGAGAGLATSELVAAGCTVTALEPGATLARLLRAQVPTCSVVVSTVEDADLPSAAFDLVVAATSMHWVDLPVALPALHRSLRPGGHLAVWRQLFGSSVATPFRARVEEIVAARAGARPDHKERDDARPVPGELASTGHFSHVESMVWPWSMAMTTDQVGALFATFSDWTDTEVSSARRAADELGGTVTEHYRTVLHILRRTDPGKHHPAVRKPQAL